MIKIGISVFLLSLSTLVCEAADKIELETHPTQVADSSTEKDCQKSELHSVIKSKLKKILLADNQPVPIHMFESGEPKKQLKEDIFKYLNSAAYARFKFSDDSIKDTFNNALQEIVNEDKKENGTDFLKYIKCILPEKDSDIFLNALSNEQKNALNQSKNLEEFLEKLKGIIGD